MKKKDYIVVKETLDDGTEFAAVRYDKLYDDAVAYLCLNINDKRGNLGAAFASKNDAGDIIVKSRLLGVSDKIQTAQEHVDQYKELFMVEKAILIDLEKNPYKEEK